MGCHLAVGANLFARLPNGQLFRANKFAPTIFRCGIHIELADLNRELFELTAKIQENFEELAV